MARLTDGIKALDDERYGSTEEHLAESLDLAKLALSELVRNIRNAAQGRVPNGNDMGIARQLVAQYGALIRRLDESVDDD